MSSTNYHLTIESVRGEMKRDSKDHGIEVQRFEFGASVARDGASGAGKQRRQYTDVKFSKLVDKSSPTLQTMLATNAKIKTATLTAHKAAGDNALVFYKIVLTDGYVSSYKILGMDFGDEFGAIPRDEFSINFRKIEVTYVKQNQKGDADGSVMFTDEVNSS